MKLSRPLTLLFLCGVCLSASATNLSCETEASEWIYQYQIDAASSSVKETLKVKGADQTLSSTDYDITFENDNIILAEYSRNHDFVVPNGKMLGQMDRFVLVFHRKESVLTKVGLSTNKHYPDPSATFISGGEYRCTVQF